MACHTRRRNSGFTLIEILITVVVLSTGIVLVLQALHDVLHIWTQASERTQAAMYSQELFMQFRSQVRAGVSPASISGPYMVDPVSGVEGLYRVRIAPESDMSIARAPERQMLFYVAPTDRDGAAR
jgi:prepilin-type N-terminal cleavage/methylation domain-containing protein